MNPDPEIRETSSPAHDLLMLADESPESVADYVGRSRCFVAQLAGRTVGQYLLLHTRPFTAEVVSLAVDPACQRRGIGTALLHHAIRTARAAGFRRLEIGTGDNATGQIALYERCGFVRCGIDRDYFRKYYPAPIIENGIECRDMVRLGMELRPDAPSEG